MNRYNGMKDALPGNATRINSRAMVSVALSLVVPYDTIPVWVVSASPQNGAMRVLVEGESEGTAPTSLLSKETSPLVLTW